ncbi:MAG: FAD-dependent oxidoreductase [Chitinophagaceae bacterium]|nr:FAD-dependent oxidoreductase [Chitinophagaceae bacterium]
MLPQWQKAIVTRIEQATPNTRRYWLELPETERFDFKPGQFVTLDLPIHEKRNKRWRSYSIASMPDGTNVIELVVVYLEGGAGTEYIFNDVVVGSELVVRGPQGVFVLHDEIPENLFMVCTGTGIAPFRSMIHYIRENNVPHGKLHLVFGTRKQEDLLYFEEMKELEKQMENFHYHPVLSREEWEGHTGYVHKVYEDLIKDLPNACFMLCGWKAMVDDAKQKLLALGYDKKNICLELYG